MRAWEILLEFDVVNLDHVRDLLDQHARSVATEEGKRWFRKSAFRHLLNEPSINRPFDEQDAAAVSVSSMPPGLSQKVENWQDHDLHVFDPPPELASDLSTLVGWIKGNEQDQRFRNSLSRISFPAAVEQAEKWHQQQTLHAARTEGVEVAREYPNGYRWVKYIDPETMKIDGQHLQNCLRDGSYAELARPGGADGVFGLRDPAHHPHVAIALKDGLVVEAKGKQNQPIGKKYVVAAIDFLNLRKPHAVSDSYLAMAGIVESRGRFVRVEDWLKPDKRDAFDDERIDHKGDFAFYRMTEATGAEVLMTDVAGSVISLHVRGQQITYVVLHPRRDVGDFYGPAPTPLLEKTLEVLNLVSMPPSFDRRKGAANYELERLGILWSRPSGFVGLHQLNHERRGDYDLYRLGDVISVRRQTRLVARLGVKNSQIAMVTNVAMPDAVVGALNAVDLPPAQSLVKSLEKSQIAYDGHAYHGGVV